ncbi:Lon protease homolog, mitochondrial [Echinococcus multilocularis]|uniref:Lon protease homolog, mitochondrial n=1 Tax=Echinococcus multilocularis TaxID=6211 RepID=A0A068XV56_ECHMU|nr:Lon protease homolog, mitochondrial [Echinococcus multilocularis]
MEFIHCEKNPTSDVVKSLEELYRVETLVQIPEWDDMGYEDWHACNQPPQDPNCEVIPDIAVDANVDSIFGD